MKLRILAIAAFLIPLNSVTPIQAATFPIFKENWQTLNSPLIKENGEVSLSTFSQTKTIILTQANTNSAALTLGQAADIISRWLDVKQKIFAPPFDRESLASLTTGILYADTVKAIEYLKNNKAYYRYGVQKVESVERFAASGNKATIEVRVTEDVTLYQNGQVENSSFNTKLVRYSLEYWDGVWKIADAQVIY